MPKACLPQNIAGGNVEGAEATVDVADKNDATACGHSRGQERRPLLTTPQLFESTDVVGGELSNIVVRAGHVTEAGNASLPSAPLDQIDRSTNHRHARLLEGNDERAGLGAVG